MRSYHCPSQSRSSEIGPQHFFIIFYVSITPKKMIYSWDIPIFQYSNAQSFVDPLIH